MAKKRKPRPEPEDLGLPLVGVETHAHLDLEDFAQDLEEVLARARASGVARIGNVFLGPAAFERGKRLFEAHPEVFFILGVHPNDAAGYDRDTARDLASAIRSEPRVRALGEIGLDFYWDRVPRQVQVQAFRDQLGLARDLGLPVVVHSRNAANKTMEVLAGEGFRDYPLLWHCFGGDNILAKKVLANGWLISVPGTLTYNGNEAMRLAVLATPLERMVLETDCPYLAPEPWRGKRNHPALMAFTAARMAELKRLPAAEVWSRCAETATRFFNLD
ncbi:MAG: TatD family hydrolase [Desulfovibrionaceae bacterium]|nr:TatD family hydrolase [Desulfovibrionaceae bacterium]